MSDIAEPEQSEWAHALDDELESVNKLSQEISDADVLRTPSTASKEKGGCASQTTGSSEEGRQPHPTTWWAHVLTKAAQDAGHDNIPAKPCQLRLVSGCTGCSAESFALKARGPRCLGPRAT